QEVVLRAQLRDMRGGLAHAEADFQDRRRGTAEGGLPVERLRGIRQDKARPQVINGTLLAGGGTSGAAHEGTDTARMRHVAAVGSLGGRVVSVVGWRRVGTGVLGEHGNKKA